MFDAIDLGSLWEWCAPEPEQCTYFRRVGEDAYQNQPAGIPLLMIRTGRKGQKEDELGLIAAPNYGSDWIVWLDWIRAAGLCDAQGNSLLKLEDYFVDAQGVGWSVVKVNNKLRQQVVVLENCCNRD